MEVHHHPDLHHGKKLFKEYLLEFLMIFLAVTLGFFAETIREKISESQREKDYIRGLINNAQSDTASLRELIAHNELELKGIDTLLKISKSNLSTTSGQDSVYFYAFEYTGNLHIFTFNDITLVQLRNAGGYSLIKTAGVADSIAQYESNNNDIVLQERFYTDSYLQTWNSLKQILDGTVATQFFQSYGSTHKIPAGMHVLISKDEEKMRVMLNNFWSFSGTLSGYISMLEQQIKYLQGFISFLKRSYDLE